jgi:hypothetical protein
MKLNEHPDVTEAKADRGQTAQSIFETVLPLSEIKVDNSIQCRDSLNRKTVAAYSEDMERGDNFPLLDLFAVEGVNLLADGGHRLEAARKTGRTSIAVRIRHGTRKDAVKFAIQANRGHGLRFSNKDKRRAVQVCLDVLADDLTDGAIAEMVGVSQPFVSKLRGQLITVMSSTSTRTGRDGKKRKVPKKKKKTTEAKTTGPSTAATTDEQAHDTDAGRDSAQPTTDNNATGGRNPTQKDSFDISNAWRQTESFLLGQLEKCPRHLHSQFCQLLGKFAADASSESPGVAADSTERPPTITVEVHRNPSGVAEPLKQVNNTPAIIETSPQLREVDELASRPRPDHKDTLSRGNVGQTREKSAEPVVSVNDRPSKAKHNGHRVNTNNTPVAGVPQPCRKSRRGFAIPWDRVNWRLTNVDLAGIWGIKPFTVRMRRHRKKHGRADKSNTEAYAKAVEAEKVKAKAFKESHAAIST